MDVLVPAPWLAQHLDEVTVVDCRFHLADPPAARAAYREAHIPGAAFMDLDTDLSDLTDAPAAGRHPLPSREAFERAARRAGIHGDRPVVAYDEGMTGGAARLWWLLRHFGHDDAHVLHGGLAAWRGELRGGDEAVAPGTFTAGPGRSATIGADELAARLGDPELAVFDARETDRYSGDAGGGPDPVGGHIPGARNLVYRHALGAVTAEPPRERDLVAYCGSGVTACVVLLALARAGRGDAALYPGSWSEWSRRGLPAETGGAAAATVIDVERPQHPEPGS